MTAADRLTVTIPFRGSLSYLREAVQSVIAQDCSRWQLIVFCDGAGEHQQVDALLTSFGDPRIALVCDAARLDITGSFNRCVDLAETDLVTLLHHDDRLMPGYISQMLTLARRHSDAAGLFCRARVIDANGRRRPAVRDVAKRLLEPRFPAGDWVLHGASAAAALVRANFIVGPSMCFRKSRLAGRRFDPRWKQVLDVALNIRLLMDGESLVGIPERHYAYRRHARQTTAQNLSRLTFFTEQAALFDELTWQASEMGWSELVQAASAKRILKLDLAYQTAGELLRLRWTNAGRRLQLLVHLSRTNPRLKMVERSR